MSGLGGKGVTGRRRKAAEGSRPLPTMQKIKGRQWQGCGPGMPGPYGLLFPASGVRGNPRLKGGGRGGGVKNGQ